MSFTLKSILLISVLNLSTQNIDSQNYYEIQVLHNSMDVEIGKPAIIKPGQNAPSVSINPIFNGVVSGILVYEDDYSLVNTIKDFPLTKDIKQVLTFPDHLNNTGRYRIDLTIKPDGPGEFYESFYFYLVNLGSIPRWSSNIVNSDNNGGLRYIPDFRGNRIPDFSTAGYKGGGVNLPHIQTKVILKPAPGDDTERIQEAINYVSSLVPDINGFRGAVQLTRGVFEVGSSLEIKTDGVVLRGIGAGDIKRPLLFPADGHDLAEFKNSMEGIDATIIIATGSKRRSLINVNGSSGISLIEDSVSEIIDQYVPVGAKSFRVANPERFRVGDKIVIQRSGNSDWISEIGMDQIPQSPSDGSIPPVQWSAFNMNFENTITAIVGSTLRVNGSVLCAIEKQWGGGRVFKYYDGNRINNVGVENFRAISFWKTDRHGSDGTNHADIFLTMSNTTDSWLKGLALEHFFSLQGAVNIALGSRQITIQNSSNLIAGSSYYSGTGYRHDRINIETGVEVGRYGFHVRGQAVLVTECYALNNRRSFVVGPRVSGPTVFLDCQSVNSLSTSEPHHRWSVGGLFDNVHDNIAITNRLYHGTGQGWSGANYVAWNTRGNLIIQKPPTAQNWSVGHKGELLKNAFRDYEFEDGYWEMRGLNVLPRSLYLQQLKDRIGAVDFERLGFGAMQLDLSNTSLKVSNFPNPADYFTIFAFYLDQRHRVNMSLFSTSGILLAKVDFGWKDTGYHELLWETSDDKGKPLDSGMYLYQFSFNHQTMSNKLLIRR